MGTGNGAEPSPLLAAQLGVSEDAVFRKWSWVSGRKLRVRRICAADPYAFHSTSSFFCMPSSVIPLFAGNTKNLATGCSVIIIEKKAESVARAFTEPHGGHGRQIASVCGGALGRTSSAAQITRKALRSHASLVYTPNACIGSRFARLDEAVIYPKRNCAKDNALALSCIACIQGQKT